MIISRSFFEVLNLRSEYELIVKDFAIPELHKAGDVISLRWFKQNGGKRNRFRKGYDRALDICNVILVYK